MHRDQYVSSESNESSQIDMNMIAEAVAHERMSFIDQAILDSLKYSITFFLFLTIVCFAFFMFMDYIERKNPIEECYTIMNYNIYCYKK